MPRAIHLASVLAVLALAPAAALAQREPPVQKELRDRFGEWAEYYTASLPSYTATETVRQTEFNRRGRSNTERVATYQYTLKHFADGAREFEESRERAAAAQKGDGAGKPPDENSIGLFSKAVLLVTRFAPRYHDRISYFFVPEHPDSISTFVVVGYRQTSGEGLMEVDGKAVYPAGRAWIDPDTGKVSRIEEEFGHVGKTRYTISVDFEDDSATRAWLPARVTVRHFDKERLELQNEYTYSAYRPL